MSGNLFEAIPDALPEELQETLLRAGGVRIERIVSTGQASPPGYWYDQDEREFVVQLTGAAGIAFEDGRVVELRPGDWLDIAPHDRHRVEWTASGEATVWLAVFVAEPDPV